jgi:hypothetical protein
MDEGTAKDFIADLQQEIRVLRRQQQQWERIARKAFTLHPGCLPKCRRACMCDCGYELYHAMIRDENKNG